MSKTFPKELMGIMQELGFWDVELQSWRVWFLYCTYSVGRKIIYKNDFKFGSTNLEGAGLPFWGRHRFVYAFNTVIVTVLAREGGHLLLPCQILLLSLFTPHALVEAGLQHAHGSFSVLQLRAGLLTLCCDSWKGNFTTVVRKTLDKLDSCWIVIPEGRWTMRTALSVVLTLWPPAPRDLNVSTRSSLGSMLTST